MVKTGDTILINKEIKAEVTLIGQNPTDNRFVINYKDLRNGGVGFFIEGDEDFEVITV
jgi:hypothetical protein